jgi:hypothetical protein
MSSWDGIDASLMEQLTGGKPLPELDNVGDPVGDIQSALVRYAIFAKLTEDEYVELANHIMYKMGQAAGESMKRRASGKKHIP